MAIAYDLKKLQPDIEIIYIGEHGGKFGHLAKDLQYIDKVKTVYAGKFRRYHKQSWKNRITDYKTNLLNFRDLFYVIIGFFQSILLIRHLKPDVIFLKGGYVGLPVGLAGALLEKAYVTHDSDSIPSLTNKLVAKWAVYNTTGMPKDLYSYPEYKTLFVGVPVAPEYKYITETIKNSSRKDINIPINAKLLLITGGSLGAIRLNKAVSDIVNTLFKEIKDLYIVHQVGKGNTSVYKNIDNPRLKVVEFVNDLDKYSAAADIIITRSGANTVAELAVQGKATIIIPNPELTGGHQTMNASILKEKDAAIVISEGELKNDPSLLKNNILNLFKDNNKREEMGNNLRKVSVPDSSKKIAMLLLTLTN